MIKSINEITIGDVILLQETKRASHLRKYKLIPSIALRQKIENIVSDIFERLGTKTIKDLENDFNRILSYRNLQKLESLWKILDIELNLKTRLSINKFLIDKKTIHNTTLIAALDKIKECGIDIKSSVDVEKFRAHIEFKTDKHIENYPEIKAETGETDFTGIIYSVFRYMNEPYNEKMRYLPFLSMKKIAEEIESKRLKDNG